MNKSLITSLIAAGAFVLQAPVVSAGNYSDSQYSWADVTRVEPVMETVEVNQPREECRIERVSRQVAVGGSRNHGNRSFKSYTPQILGAVIGGAIGRKAGRGRGQDVATVAGAVLGGSIGRDIGRNNRRGYDNTRYETVYEDVRRCETVNDYHTEERVIGYKVQYVYDGKSFWTRMANDPGSRIKVRVSVEPVVSNSSYTSDGYTRS